MTIFEDMARQLRLRPLRLPEIQFPERPDFDVPTIDMEYVRRSMNAAADSHSRKMRAISDALRRPYNVMSPRVPGEPFAFPEELKKNLAANLRAAVTPRCEKHSYTLAHTDRLYYHFDCKNCDASALMGKHLVRAMTTTRPEAGKALFASGRLWVR